MNEEQTANVVAYLNRAGLLYAMTGQVGVWHDAIGDRCRYEDAVEACRNLSRDPALAGRRGGSFLIPGDVLAEVKRIRARRTAGHEVPGPPEVLSDDPAAGLRFQREYIRALGDSGDPESADAEACRALGVQRPAALGAPDPQRVRALLSEVGRNV
ncbi:hypothetical protein [Glutamicibacter arilaitensis]|uniref:Uncharacterized protein n=1 Tax=Glutamicibacter arilaitensis TaxID=256701 RepID=A0A2N7S671_9MICC|nr:hypothetical protein [Glutamicibacter arilaitensis]PMQ21642.1 hypothetical protein CIK84_08960 [Glutamicibacter arilaitensis]